MSRRRRDGAPFSLFPFLNVLVCLFGALTLMIGASAFGHIGRKAAPVAVQRGENLALLDRQLSLISGEMQIIESRMEAAQRIEYQLNLTSAELALLQPKLAEHKKQLHAEAEKKSQLEAQLADVGPRVAQLETELKQRFAKNQELQNELARRTEPSPDANVQVRPSNTARDASTVFVECRSDGILLYNEDKPRLVPAGDVKKSAALLELLGKLSADPEALVVFLVRTDGISNYYVARDIARSKSCRNGKIPIVGQGDIDLSLVKKGLDAASPDAATSDSVSPDAASPKPATP